jgi:hypothetical protein
LHFYFFETKQKICHFIDREEVFECYKPIMIKAEAKTQNKGVTLAALHYPTLLPRRPIEPSLFLPLCSPCRWWSGGSGKHAHFYLSTPPKTRAWQAKASPFWIDHSFA